MSDKNARGFRINPLPRSSLTSELSSQIDSAREAGVLSDSLPVQIWAYRPEIAGKWLSLLSEFHNESILDERIRELMRLKIASVTNCDICQLARKSDRVSEADIACIDGDDGVFTDAERAAMNYAYLFATDFQSIGCDMFTALKEYFSEAEIVEITMYCALMLGGGRMTFVHRKS